MTQTERKEGLSCLSSCDVDKVLGYTQLVGVGQTVAGPRSHCGHYSAGHEPHLLRCHICSGDLA